MIIYVKEWPNYLAGFSISNHPSNVYTFRYICTAYDVDGVRTTAEAYLEIRDICAGNDCQSPQVKSTIKHVQKTYP